MKGWLKWKLTGRKQEERERRKHEDESWKMQMERKDEKEASWLTGLHLGQTRSTQLHTLRGLRTLCRKLELARSSGLAD